MNQTGMSLTGDKKVKLYTTIFCLLFAGITNAANVNVPNTFTSGAPARAAEVNENFSALDSAVNDNSARLDVMEAGTGSTYPPLVELNVSGVNAGPGDMVDVGGETAEIFEYIFRRFDTDEEFVLEYPQLASDTVSINVQLVRNPPLSQGGSPGQANTYRFSMGGFDSRLSQAYGVNQYSFPSGGIQGGIELSQNRTFSDSIQVLIGEETMLSLSYRDSSPLPASSTKTDLQAYMDRRLTYLKYLKVRPKN
jgi:hypothetical protein